MTVYSWISMDLVCRIGWSLMHSLWEGAAIAAILTIGLACISSRTAQVRYVANLLAMLAILAAFGVTFAMAPPSRFPAETRPAGYVSSDSDQSGQSARLAGAETEALSQPSTVRPKDSAQPADAIALTPVNWTNAVSPVAAFTWLGGVLLLAAWRAAGWLSVQRLRVIKTEPVDRSVMDAAHRLAHRLGLSQRFEILLSHFTVTPVVIGWLRPVILIPAGIMTGLTPSQLEGILAHELAHIRRYDYLVNLIQILAETLLFYHPAVWWLSRQIRLEREQACDDAALSLCADRCEYARSLAALEELRLAGSPALAAHGSGGRQMLTRIRRIVGAAQVSPRYGSASVLSLLVIVAAAVVFSQTTIAQQTPTTQRFSLRNNAAKLSPFTAVRWRGDVPEAQFKGAWYEVISIDNTPVARIMEYLTGSRDSDPKKHFAEDLVEVMRDMGNPTGQTVKLELKTLDTQQVVKVPDAAMTEENRRSVYNNARVTQHNPAAVSTAPAFFLRNDAKRLSPFIAVRWRGDVPEGKFEGAWYEVVSINDVPVARIMDYLNSSKDFAPRKHFAEDLVEVMRDMGNPTDKTVKLELKGWDPIRAVTVPEAPMTEENRTAVLLFDASPPPDQPLPTTRAAADDIFMFDVPFKQGATQFLDGDKIIVTSVKGTGADMESGICCISGTYMLASHDTATLAASVTASESQDGTGPWNSSQMLSVQKGAGTFRLLLPISVKGWPHVSFYGQSRKETAKAELFDAQKKTAYIQQDLAHQEAALAFKRKELDALSEKYGTADLDSRNQALQTNLVALEAELDHGKIALNDERAAGGKDVNKLAEHVDSVTKIFEQARLECDEVGAQRQQIEDVRDEIEQIEISRDRDLHSLERLGALIESAAISDFGGSYIGTGNWVLQKWWGK